MADKLLEARRELALANRIVANEGVLDAFGHVSMRHPDNPKRYFLSRSRAPELVEADDLIEYDLDSQPVREPGVSQYSERVIHGEIYKARPDVMSVVHTHSPGVIPFSVSQVPLRAMYHNPAFLAGGVPVWDIRKDFGDTNMLVSNAAIGKSLAARKERAKYCSIWSALTP